MLTQLNAAVEEIKSAARSVRRSPGFGVAVLATLAVGVGGNLATLSIVDRLLFRGPPGVSDAGSMRRVYASERRAGAPWISHTFSFPDVRDFADASRGAATVVGYREAPNLAIGDSMLVVKAGWVGDDYFELFGLRPRLGRLFLREEMSGRSSPVAVISEPLWRWAFGSAPETIGRVVQLAGKPVTIVGVLAGPFQGIDLDPMDLWMPLSLAPPVRESTGDMRTDRNTRPLLVLAKLTATARHEPLAARLTEEYRRTRESVWGGDTAAVVRLTPLAVARGEGLLMPMDLRNVALAKRLAGVAVAVLVVSIGNVFVLFLVRAIRRRKELAVRMAIGASRLRIAIELLTEGLLLGSAAALVAIVAGTWFGALLGSWLLPPTAFGPIVDRNAIVIAGLVGITIGCVAGLAPLTFGPAVDGGQALRLDAVSGDKRGTQLRTILLATQVSLCIALISVAATFQQSLIRVARTNLGVDRERIITVTTSGQLREGAVREAVTRMRAVPGVVAVGNADADLPPGAARGRFALPGRDGPLELPPSHNFVDSSYLRAGGILVLQGRGLEPSDFVGFPAVAIVSESMANALWQGRTPLGECIFALGNTARCTRVVGVVRDIRWDLSSPPQPHYYMPLTQVVGQGHAFVVRTRERATAATVAEIERIAITTLGNGVKRPRVLRVADRLERQIRPWKAAATLFMLFGLLALVGSAAGVYATVSYEMAQRRTELGVRLTLGATLTDLLRVVVRPVSTACAVGAIAGMTLAIAGGRIVASFLFDTTPANLTALCIGVGTVSAAAFLATLAPSWRVTRLNLASVLRV